MKTLMRQGGVWLLLLTAVVVFPTTSRAQDSSDASRKVLVKIAPVYPTLAHSMNIHGAVKVEALIEPNGTVKSVTVIGGHPLLTQSAVTAVGHWKFEAGPHESREVIELKFDSQ
jgi:TonB family protein